MHYMKYTWKEIVILLGLCALRWLYVMNAKSWWARAAQFIARKFWRFIGPIARPMGAFFMAIAWAIRWMVYRAVFIGGGCFIVPLSVGLGVGLYLGSVMPGTLRIVFLWVARAVTLAGLVGYIYRVFFHVCIYKWPWLPVAPCTISLMAEEIALGLQRSGWSNIRLPCIERCDNRFSKRAVTFLPCKCCRHLTFGALNSSTAGCRFSGSPFTLALFMVSVGFWSGLVKPQ